MQACHGGTDKGETKPMTGNWTSLEATIEKLRLDDVTPLAEVVKLELLLSIAKSLDELLGAPALGGA